MNDQQETQVKTDFLNNIDSQQFATDVKLCLEMSSLTSSKELLALDTRLLEYIEVLESMVVWYEGLSKIAKAKRDKYKQYHQVAKEHKKELSILEYNASK